MDDLMMRYEDITGNSREDIEKFFTTEFETKKGIGFKCRGIYYYISNKYETWIDSVVYRLTELTLSSGGYVTNRLEVDEYYSFNDFVNVICALATNYDKSKEESDMVKYEVLTGKNYSEILHFFKNVFEGHKGVSFKCGNDYYNVSTFEGNMFIISKLELDRCGYMKAADCVLTFTGTVDNVSTYIFGLANITKEVRV